jgi:1,2-phenylacetyl-CoA epoxidase catalytic subunit
MAKWSDDRKKAHSDAMRKAWVTRRNNQLAALTNKKPHKKTRAMNRVEAASTFVRSCGGMNTAKQVLRAFEQLGGTAGARKHIALVETLNNKDGNTNGNHSG